ncbi:MAG: ABC transporter permease [bacterium]|nr:ABC transporter permease [bacterium]
MEFITVALLGALLTTPQTLVPASLALRRGQKGIAFLLTIIGLGIGLASPFLTVVVSLFVAMAVMVIATAAIYFLLPPQAKPTTEPSISLSVSDILALLASSLMLFCFFFMNWYTRLPIDIDTVPQSLMARLYGGSLKQLNINYVLEARMALQDFNPLMLLFVIPAIFAFVITVAGIFSAKIRPTVAVWTLRSALVAFAYYVIYTINSHFFLPVVKMADVGFWVGFFATILLIFQAVLPRPAVIVQKQAAKRSQVEVVGDDGVITLHTEQITQSISNFGRAARRLRRDRLTLVAMFALGILMVITFISPWINQQVLGKDSTATYGRNLWMIDGRPMPVPPGGCSFGQCYVLGSDQIGRDYLARIMEGGRISLAIAFISAVLTATVGTVLGMAAGYFGGVFDDFMNWVITTLNALPALYLLIAISAILKPDPSSLVIVFVVTGWTGSMRLIRGQTIGTRNLDYVMAARALGASPWRIMFQHILPNMVSILSVSLALGIGGIILAEAALSFLNLGISAATPTWGNMLSKVQENLQGFFRYAPHIVIVPGLLISMTVLCLFIVGDGVRDAFDPTINE